MDFVLFVGFVSPGLEHRAWHITAIQIFAEQMTNQGRLEGVGGLRFLKHETGLFLNYKEPYRLFWVIISSVDEETSLRDSYHKKQADSSMPLQGPGLSLHSELQGPSSSIP